MSLAIYTSAAWTANGGLQVADNATIEVRRESDGALASIYSDREGEEPITNPSAFGDASGRFQFFAAGGAYRVKVTQDGKEYTLRYQAIGTAAAEDVSAFDAAGSADAAETAAKSYTDDHATETGGIHGIPEGERAVHTADLGPAPDNVPTNQQLADGVERGGGNTVGISSVVFAKEIDQPLGDQVLLLCKATERAFISGTITGLRDSGSSAANSSSILDVFVRLGNDGSPSIGFVTGGGRDGRSIEPTNLITVEYDNETYVAIRAQAGFSTRGFEHAVFTGVNTNGVFQWITDDDALDQQDFSGATVSFFGRPGDSIQGQSLYIAGDIGDTVEVMIDGDGNVVEA